MASKALKDGTLVWARCRGLNDFDNPEELPDDMAVEAQNVVFVRSSLAQKRRGSAAQTITGSFSGYNALMRFVPGQNDGAAELHFVDRSGNPKWMRVAAGTSAAELTPSPADFFSVTTDAQGIAGGFATYPAALNGKLYAAFRSDVGGGATSHVNRLHVYDPTISTTVFRRSGLPDPALPTVADHGSGAYEAIPRYYRIRWLYVSGSRVKLMSNAGAVSARFTPSGSGAEARVTKPANPTSGELATYWRVEGSADDSAYYILSGNIAVATTTYDDTEDPPNYSENEAVPEVGAFTPFPSVKYIISTGDRNVGFGAWETPASIASGAGADAMAPYNGRVWFSPVLGTTDTDDDERISNTTSNKGWIDMGRDANAEDRAIVGPMDGQIFVFQSRGMWMLVGSGLANAPFRRITISPVVGAVSHASSFIGQDESGNPCVYFLDPETGPMRYGSGGLQWCGYDVQNFWSTVNLSATTRVAHGLYDYSTRRCIWWIATGASNDPDTMLVFHTREGVPTPNEGVRKGWAKWTGALGAARTSSLFAETVGATMSRRLKPYAGLSASLLRAEDSSATDDNGTTFQAYLKSKAWAAGPLSVYKMVGKSYLKALVASGVTITQTFIRNFGDEANRTDTVTLTADGSETRVMKRFQSAALTDAYTFQTQIGDAAAVSNNWLIDKWVTTLDVTTEER